MNQRPDEAGSGQCPCEDTALFQILQRRNCAERERVIDLEWEDTQCKATEPYHAAEQDDAGKPYAADIGHGENVFVRRIFEKETGKGLICRYHEAETPAKTFGLSWWSVQGIAYDEVMRQTVEALRAEQKMAFHALEMLESPEASREKAVRMERISSQARILFDEMKEIEAPDLERYQKMERGEIQEAEYRQKRAQMQQQIQEKDPAFSNLLEQMKELNKAFDRRNPWIRRYSSLEIPETLTKEQVRKWISRLTVKDMAKVEVEIPEEYEWWKDQLPAAWMEAEAWN